MESNFDLFVTAIISFWPFAENVFAVLGGLVVFGFFVDSVIPDKYDHGFMTHLMAIPVLGAFLKFISKFSPFHKEEK